MDSERQFRLRRAGLDPFQSSQYLLDWIEGDEKYRQYLEEYWRYESLELERLLRQHRNESLNVD
jgi:hypothetical protein